MGYRCRTHAEQPGVSPFPGQTDTREDHGCVKEKGMSKEVLITAPRFSSDGGAYQAVDHVREEGAEGNKPVVDGFLQRDLVVAGRSLPLTRVNLPGGVTLTRGSRKETAAGPDGGASDSDMRQGTQIEPRCEYV